MSVSPMPSISAGASGEPNPANSTMPPMAADHRGKLELMIEDSGRPVLSHALTIDHMADTIRGRASRMVCASNTRRNFRSAARSSDMKSSTISTRRWRSAEMVRRLPVSKTVAPASP